MKRLAMLMIVVLFVAPTAFADWTIDEGFEGGAIPVGWTVVGGGDSDDWFAYNNTAYAHTGDWVVAVAAYSSANAGNDWLITPQVAVSGGDVIEFYARSWYGTEDFEVWLSTTGNSPGDFGVMLGSATAGDSHVKYDYDLTPYAGQNCYLAIVWFYNDYALVVDDIRVGQEASPVDGASWAAIKAMYR
ncbi:choice-of-anchor J domain-containing protein [bacterium]|nr:choice-of-anchor J domain-containing protein [bacterium]